MSVVPLVALKRLIYAGQPYVVGETFDARDASDATVLKTLGLAADSNVFAAPSARVESTRVPSDSPIEPHPNVVENAVEPAQKSADDDGARDVDPYPLTTDTTEPLVDSTRRRQRRVQK